MGDDGKSLEIWCADSSGLTFSANFDEKTLTRIRDSVDKSLTWEKFFKGIDEGFSQRKVQCSRQDGSISLLVECLLPSSSKKATFRLEKVASTDGCNDMLKSMQEFYWVRTEPGYGQKLLEEISSGAGSGGVDPKQMADIVARAPQVEKAIQEELGRLESEAAKVSSAGSTRGPSCAEELSGLVIETVDYDNDIFLGRHPLRDCRGQTRVKKDIDLDLLKLLKSKFTPRQDGEPDTIESNEDFKWCSVIRPFTANEFTSQMKGLSDRGQSIVMNCFKKLDEWDFDVYTIQGFSDASALFCTSYALFHRYGIMKKFNLDETKLIAFLSQAESGYHPNPYHNSSHAADVLHILHYIMMPGGLIKVGRLSDEDQFAALLAALIHDYDHPGINNNFHVKTQSYLARLYNDRSILENHHAAEIFELMKDPRFDMMSSCTPEQRKEIRETVVEMILATDMGLHAKILGTFKRRFQEERETADQRGGQIFHRRDDVRLALSMGIKMADISNCGRPEHLYLKWASKIADEFFMQGDREKNLGLPISPFMDRSQPSMAKGQIAFMNYIVIPLFESIADYLPDMRFTVDHVESNKSYWQANDDSAV
eukprot:NODE_524_length_2000_cov_59.356740_g418_i0.p1 GENE.NODE_524_length_2000_cov_59.356740_g418_i0~~NODE_524_length_2000_cov_59.356740_g418_i0.p1  ORF type:complete len:603 (-),score=193.63 NODE_524_length_2000_cov_59.356740_g418_i0:192-1979(-)